MRGMCFLFLMLGPICLPCRSARGEHGGVAADEDFISSSANVAIPIHTDESMLSPDQDEPKASLTQDSGARSVVSPSAKSFFLSVGKSFPENLRIAREALDGAVKEGALPAESVPQLLQRMAPVVEKMTSSEEQGGYGVNRLKVTIIDTAQGKAQDLLIEAASRTTPAAEAGLQPVPTNETSSLVPGKNVTEGIGLVRTSSVRQAGLGEEGSLAGAPDRTYDRGRLLATADVKDEGTSDLLRNSPPSLPPNDDSSQRVPTRETEGFKVLDPPVRKDSSSPRIIDSESSIRLFLAGFNGDETAPASTGWIIIGIGMVCLMVSYASRRRNQFRRQVTKRRE